MAVDTPTMLPVPTRDAVDTMSAPNEEMLPFSFGFSATTWMDSPNRRNWIRPVRIVKYRPATIRNSGTDVRLVQKAADRIDHTVNFVNHDLSPLQFFIFPAAKQPRDR